MNDKLHLIYEGKAKKIFAHKESDKVLIEFKDDATAFNAIKKAKFEGKGELNCYISSSIFEFLIENDIPTHFVRQEEKNIIIAKKVKIIPLEVVVRNIAYGSLCKQTPFRPGTVLDNPLIDLYFKNDHLNDPLITHKRILMLKILNKVDLEFIEALTLTINDLLKEFFNKIKLELVDFKLEFGHNLEGEIVLADEISPDNCRLWDLCTDDVKMKSLDKDRFRNDLGDLLEAYSEIKTRIDNFIYSKEKQN